MSTRNTGREAPGSGRRPLLLDPGVWCEKTPRLSLSVGDFWAILHQQVQLCRLCMTDSLTGGCDGHCCRCRMFACATLPKPEANTELRSLNAISAQIYILPNVIAAASHDLAFSGSLLKKMGTGARPLPNKLLQTIRPQSCQPLSA